MSMHSAYVGKEAKNISYCIKRVMCASTIGERFEIFKRKIFEQKIEFNSDKIQSQVFVLTVKLTISVWSPSE